MTAHGNPTQWQAGFLPRSLLEADLSRAEIEARVRFQEQYFHTEIRL